MSMSETGDMGKTGTTCVACGGDAGLLVHDGTPAEDVIHVGCAIALVAGKPCSSQNDDYETGWSDGYADCRDGESRTVAGRTADYVRGYVDGTNERCDDEDAESQVTGGPS